MGKEGIGQVDPTVTCLVTSPFPPGRETVPVRDVTYRNLVKLDAARLLQIQAVIQRGVHSLHTVRAIH